MVLDEGQIAEMKTGEVKTLVATLPSHLKALTDEGFAKAEQMLAVADLLNPQAPWSHDITKSFKAKELFLKHLNYIVRDGQAVAAKWRAKEPKSSLVATAIRWPV